MTAVALAPAPSPRHPAPGPERDLLLRFGVDGQIQWMSRSAREAFGSCTDLITALTFRARRGPTPALKAFPLGAEWLWVGAEAGASAGRREKIGRAIICLLGLYHQRRSGNIELSRARGQVEARGFLAARSRRAGGAGTDLIEAVETERGRIARELHDNAGQGLVGILLNLELVERHLGSAQTEVLARLARSRELASATLDQIRRISHELYQPEWRDTDFSSALERLVETMGLRARLRVDAEAVRIPNDLSPTLKTILYRTLQEGLTNVVRHAHASRVTIQASAIAGEVSLCLQDDGQGFDPASPRAAPAGIGLANIRKRVESVGGRFEIHSAPSRGARLSVIVPAGQDPS